MDTFTLVMLAWCIWGIAFVLSSGPPRTNGKPSGPKLLLMLFIGGPLVWVTAIMFFPEALRRARRMKEDAEKKARRD